MKRIFPCIAALVCALALAACQAAPDLPSAPASSPSSGGEESAPATSGKPAEIGYQLHTITLPANQLPAGYSPGHPKEHPKLEPFNLSIQLPESWTVEVSKELDDTYGDYLCFPVTFYENGKEIGSLSYSPVDIFDYDDPPSPDDPGFYVGVYSYLMTPNLVSWDDAYTPVVRTSTSCTVTCRIRAIIPEENKSAVGIHPVYSNAILSYNLGILEYVAISFQDGQPGSQDVLRTIAKSIVLAPVSGSDATPSPYTQTPAQSVSLTFPANDLGKTAANASDYDIRPFSISFLLPEGWSAQEVTSPEEFIWIPLVSKYKIFNPDKVCVGVAGCNSYHIRGGYEDAEDDPAAIYSKIALGFDWHFIIDEDSYRAIKGGFSGTSALADVYSFSNFLRARGVDHDSKDYDRGIVSYNKDKMVYVAFEFDSTQVSEDQVTAIAQSLSFE